MGKTTLLKNRLRSDVHVLVGYGGSSAVVGKEISALIRQNFSVADTSLNGLAALGRNVLP